MYEALGSIPQEQNMHTHTLGLKAYFTFDPVFACESVSGCMCMSVGAHEGQKRTLNPKCVQHRCREPNLSSARIASTQPLNIPLLFTTPHFLSFETESQHLAQADLKFPAILRPQLSMHWNCKPVPPWWVLKIPEYWHGAHKWKTPHHETLFQACAYTHTQTCTHIHTRSDKHIPLSVCTKCINGTFTLGHCPWYRTVHKQTDPSGSRHLDERLTHPVGLPLITKSQAHVKNHITRQAAPSTVEPCVQQSCVLSENGQLSPCPYKYPPRREKSLGNTSNF